MWKHGEMTVRRQGDTLRFLMPAPEVIRGFVADYDRLPNQSGRSLSAAGIIDHTLTAQELMKTLQTMIPPNGFALRDTD
jgi:arylsulfatase